MSNGEANELGRTVIPEGETLVTRDTVHFLQDEGLSAFDECRAVVRVTRVRIAGVRVSSRTGLIASSVAAVTTVAPTTKYVHKMSTPGKDGCLVINTTAALRRSGINGEGCGRRSEEDDVEELHSEREDLKLGGSNSSDIGGRELKEEEKANLQGREDGPATNYRINKDNYY